MRFTPIIIALNVFWNIGYISIINLSICESYSPFFHNTEKDILDGVHHAKTNIKIYIYPIPSSVLPYECNSSRIGGYNAIEYELPNYIKNSTLYTTNPEEADYFLVNHQFHCMILMRSLNTSSFHKQYLDPIWNQFINSHYYNRKYGHDHLLISIGDLGMFCEQKRCRYRGYFSDKYIHAIENFTILSYQAFANVHLASDRILNHFHRQDKYAKTSLDCFRINKDISLPQYTQHKYVHINRPINLTLSKRPYLFRFKGKVNNTLECSLNSRWKLQQIMHALQSRNMIAWQGSSKESDAYFNFAPSGFGCWSFRLFASIYSNSLPIIVAQGQTQPFERFLDWTQFSLKIDTDTVKHSVFGAIAKQFEFSSKGWTVRQTFRSNLQPYFDNVHTVSPWLFWNKISDKSAWSLLFLELLCRTSKGIQNMPHLCSRDDAQVAKMTYVLNMTEYYRNDTPFWS